MNAVSKKNFSYTGSLLEKKESQPKLFEVTKDHERSDLPEKKFNVKIPSNPKETMSDKQVCDLLKISKNTLRNYRYEGKLGHYWEISSQKILYSRYSVEKLFEASYREEFEVK
jgi:hypothetical protein